jgi:hypothetical protein
MSGTYSSATAICEVDAPGLVERHRAWPYQGVERLGLDELHHQGAVCDAVGSPATEVRDLYLSRYGSTKYSQDYTDSAHCRRWESKPDTDSWQVLMPSINVVYLLAAFGPHEGRCSGPVSTAAVR